MWAHLSTSPCRHQANSALHQRPKTHHNNSFSGSVATWHVPSFDDPEVATAKLARKVVLDLNDPQLLLDIQSQDYAPKKQPENALYGGSIVKKTATLSRYNISNDSAYDLLKENHQNKVRGTLGNLAVEHGMPALRLQYPYVGVLPAIPLNVGSLNVSV